MCTCVRVRAGVREYRCVHECPVHLGTGRRVGVCPTTLSLMATKSPKLHIGSVCRARRYASATGETDAPSNPLYELA